MKLVRDKIPEIMKKKGLNPKTHIANENEIKARLFEKIKEEIAEFEKNPSIEEMADIHEVLDAICKHFNLDQKIIAKKREEKRISRGGFIKKIILE